MMFGRILFLVVVASGSLAAQDSDRTESADVPRPDLNVTAAAPRKCSIPLVNLRPAQSTRMPKFKPPAEFVSKRFFIEPPAPPCEDEKRDPLVSRVVPMEKDQPQTK